MKFSPSYMLKPLQKYEKNMDFVCFFPKMCNFAVNLIVKVNNV